MTLLLDENLSRKLARQFADLYPGLAHVSEADLLQASDPSIWQFAPERSLSVVTTDSDFLALAGTTPPPPKVILLRRWRHPTRDAEELLRREAIRVAQFLATPRLSVLVLEK